MAMRTNVHGLLAVAQNVGFYYTANATGRLLGTLLSGAVYQAAGGGRAGLSACLATSMLAVLLSVVSGLPLRAAERRPRPEVA